MREPVFKSTDEVARVSGVLAAGKKARMWEHPLLKCHYCDRPAVNRDHVVPKKRGGVDSWWNLAQSCYQCNQKKGSSAPTCTCPFCSRAARLWSEGVRRPGYGSGMLRVQVRRARHGWYVSVPSAFSGVPFVSYWPTWESAMESLDKAKKGV